MSIRPIDFHVTYATTVNESKAKQNEFNRNREISSIAEHQQAVEVEKNKKRVINTEAAQEKKVKSEDRDNQPKDWQQNKKDNKKDGQEEKQDIKELAKKGETKGLKIDIMI